MEPRRTRMGQADTNEIRKSLRHENRLSILSPNDRTFSLQENALRLLTCRRQRRAISPRTRLHRRTCWRSSRRFITPATQRADGSIALAATGLSQRFASARESDLDALWKSDLVPASILRRSPKHTRR